jgi:hypothetical protein
MHRFCTNSALLVLMVQGCVMPYPLSGKSQLVKQTSLALLSKVKLSHLRAPQKPISFVEKNRFFAIGAHINNDVFGGASDGGHLTFKADKTLQKAIAHLFYPRSFTFSKADL